MPAPESIRTAALRPDLAALAAVLLAMLAQGPALALQKGGEPRVERHEQIVVRTVEDGETGDGPVRRRVVAKVVTDDVLGPRLQVSEGDGEPSVFGAFAMRRAFLGVGLVDITPELRDHFGAPRDAGVLVSRVEEDSPAAAAGLAVGDVLVSAAGESLAFAHQVVRAIGGREQGEVVDLEVVRDGRRKRLAATLAERERPQLDVGPMLWRQCLGDEEDCVVGDLELEIEGMPTLGGTRIDGEALGEAMRELRTRMASPEWRERMEAFRLGREELTERLRELERRLEELERELAERERG